MYPSLHEYDLIGSQTNWFINNQVLKEHTHKCVAYVYSILKLMSFASVTPKQNVYKSDKTLPLLSQKVCFSADLEVVHGHIKCVINLHQGLFDMGYLGHSVTEWTQSTVWDVQCCAYTYIWPQTNICIHAHKHTSANCQTRLGVAANQKSDFIHNKLFRNDTSEGRPVPGQTQMSQ